MCEKLEAGLGGTRTDFNYRDPGPLASKGTTKVCLFFGHFLTDPEIIGISSLVYK